MALQRLREAAERTKIELSGSMLSEVNLPYISADAAGPKHLQLKITRAKFEALVEDIVMRSKGPCLQALKDAGLQASDIDEAVLVGGTTRIPRVHALVKELFGKEPNRSINPDEAVALGAAIQAGVLAGDVKDILLLDVTPLTLGVETYGGVMTPLIARNTTVPTEKAEVFSTAADSQPAVDIHVLQGERPMASDNRTLGRFQLAGIPPAPRGVPQIEVKFAIDANGILHVSAKDKGTGKEQSIVIKAGSGISENDIARMVEDAKKNEEADKKKRELIDLKNQSDQIVYATEKSLREYGDKVTAADRGKIEAALNNLKQMKDGDSIAAIRRAIDELNNASQEMGKAIYEQVARQQGAAGAASSQPGAAGGGTPKAAPDGKGGKVVDADFEVVDDDKK
jgi:molecular chaperone DnaK